MLDALQWAGIRAGAMGQDSWLPDGHLPWTGDYAKDVELNDTQALPSQVLLSNQKGKREDTGLLQLCAPLHGLGAQVQPHRKSGCSGPYLPDE